MGRLEIRIDDASPALVHARGGRQLEAERLPVRVDDDVDEQFALEHARRQREAVGLVAPVRAVELDPVPVDPRSP